jgi:hypothetical protein
MLTKRIRPLLFLAGMLLLLTACNFPGEFAQPTTGPDVIYTAAAQTLSAQYTQAAAGTPIVIASPTSGGAAATPTSPVVIVPTDTLAPTNTQPPTNTPPPPNTPVPPTQTPVPIPCDRASFVKDITVPDNTEIAAGATFVKTWQLKNNGSCTWTSGYALVFYNGDAMSGPASSQITSGTVPPGSTIDISVTLIAPTTPGNYTGNWRLRNAGGALFGIGQGADQSFWVKIKAVSPTPTPSPTPAYTLSYDFIERGDDATWRNATTNLSWGDPPEDSAGVAVDVANVKLEDGRTYSRVLATYPQHIADGKIFGLYTPYTIQANDHLRTQIGFRQNCGTSSIRYQIHYIEGQSDVTVLDQLETCDGKIATIDVNLSALVGRTVQFQLVTIAVGSPDSYTSVWVSPRIER